MASESETMLLPCPFCGGEAEFETTTDPRGDCNCVRCDDCDYSLMNGPVGIGWFSTAKEAAESWNRRAPSAEAKDDGSIVLSREGQEILARGMAAHGAVVQYLTMGRPDLALAEAQQWVEGISGAANIIREQDAIAKQGAAAAPVYPIGDPVIGYGHVRDIGEMLTPQSAPDSPGT